jgi:putative ubiquitin-RnfH superfamily antitoxin RatB of RatAB toxin-antitoxin module
MKVSVAYAGSDGAAIVTVDLPDTASVADAVAASGVVTRFGLFEAALSYAIFGQHAKPGTPLRDGDRVELLRPLLADPKEARRKRAAEHPLPRQRPRRKPRG